MTEHSYHTSPIEQRQMPLLELRHMAKTFPAVKALADVSIGASPPEGVGQNDPVYQNHLLLQWSASVIGSSLSPAAMHESHQAASTPTLPASPGPVTPNTNGRFSCLSAVSMLGAAPSLSDHAIRDSAVLRCNVSIGSFPLIMHDRCEPNCWRGSWQWMVARWSV